MILLSYLCLFFILINNLEAKLVPLIYGGAPIPPDQHQYLVRLVKHHKNNRMTSCSGSILNNQWIISSAHCFTDDVLWVSVTTENDFLAVVPRTNVYNYPGYVHYRRENRMPFTNAEKDLALLKVDGSIKFYDKVKPIKLPKGPVIPNLEVTIAGYGKSEFKFGKPRQGKTVVTDCEFPIETNLICTIDSVGSGPGDSGGPLVANGALVGVVSARLPEVEKRKLLYVTTYVDVYLNLKWIKHVMASN